MKHLLIMMVCLVSIQLYGQDDALEYIDSTDEGMGLYAKPSHVKVEDKDLGIYKVWISVFINNEDVKSTQAKLVAKFNDDKLKNTHSGKLLYYVNCKKDMLGVCRAIYYDKDGKVLLSIEACEYDVQYRDIVPDSVGESIFNYTCKVAQSKR